MLDFFTIFSKGGIVLWYFQGTSQLFTPSINALIKNVILQERSGNNQFTHEALTLKYKLDNEFELVFVVAYQKILQLSYIDKFLTDIQLEFRNKYKDDLLQGKISGNFSFESDFTRLLKIREDENKQEKAVKKMKTFEESQKSKKTVSSMIENKKDEQPNKKANKGKENKPNFKNVTWWKFVPLTFASFHNVTIKEPEPVQIKQTDTNGSVDEDTIMANRMKFFNKMSGQKKTKSPNTSSPQSAEKPKKKGKAATKWDMAGTSKDMASLDFSNTNGSGDNGEMLTNGKEEIPSEMEQAFVGQMKGGLRDIEPDSESEEEFEEEEEIPETTTNKARIDILRDAMEAKQQKRPFCITFCGVNGVGKSTNLAKICFWLIENGFRVLIAACDTFRAGAVEQLRTHTRKLNALHPPEQHSGQHMVQLYEKGYGKDAAGIAMEAINYARDCHIDIVLVDTAGRMQDNEPLMRALSKPDLVLFVGEALVGNEAVDQLMKFNQALADHSNMTNPRLIDGIILTKFDTIDDKVGAAISMTYTTGQPIVFVGTGQTYTDLRNLNARAVVNALLKA
ncbi:hypothetical protein KUTeg_006189 [Tegillarca granosa]|uniref:SRP54-type proteins GTP-binding domain-containing protein n=1 Tax=Tegillarca granosa TaxID=220873 RepID=A0ABQ9FFV6_TEGGR|nr:hypothetical protein KUTeg_006189 [Tegillarca granosa]